MRDPGCVSEMAMRVGLMANGLGLGRRVDLWSLVLATLALVGLVWSMRQSLLWPTVLLLLSVLVAGVQKVLALRVAFDEAVFRSWAERWQRVAIGDGGASNPVADDLLAFDRALVVLGLRGSAGDPRELDDRLRGAAKLLARQLMAFGLQFAVLLVTALVVFMMPAF